MDEDDTPKLWLSALKIVAAAALLIGTIGFALWYANRLPVSSPALEQAIEDVRQKNPDAKSSPANSWGIAKDSPLRNK